MPRSRKAAALVLVLALAATLVPPLSAAPHGRSSRDCEVRETAESFLLRFRKVVNIVIGQSGCEMDPNGHIICKP